MAAVPTLPRYSTYSDPHPLVWAAQNGDIDKVKELLKKGEDPNSEWINRTALIMASIKGYTQIIAELILADADVNKSTKNTAPLYYAAQNGNLQAVELLLKAGANVTKPDEPGFTPLWDAASWEYPNILRLLVKYGAIVPDPDELTAKGNLKGAEQARILRRYISDVQAVKNDKIRSVLVGNSIPIPRNVSRVIGSFMSKSKFERRRKSRKVRKTRKNRKV